MAALWTQFYGRSVETKFYGRSVETKFYGRSVETKFYGRSVDIVLWPLCGDKINVLVVTGPLHACVAWCLGLSMDVPREGDCLYSMDTGIHVSRNT